jgi:hypothetical protein
MIRWRLLGDESPENSRLTTKHPKNREQTMVDAIAGSVKQLPPRES